MNIVAIQCRTNTGELMEVPVREFFSMTGEFSITPTGTVPKSNGKEYVASGITVDANGVVTFKSYTKPGIIDGTASGIIAHDANGRLITIPITLQGQTQKQNVTQSSTGTSTENILPVYSDGNGTLSDSTILKDGENYSVGGATAFFKWDISLGSVNINQGTSVENGYRLNGKLVVSYDPVTEEITIGNATYTTTNIENVKVKSAIFTTALGGTITDVAFNTAGNYTLIKPDENGTYATREWSASNTWLINGNTITSEKFFGTVTGSDYDISIKRNGIEVGKWITGGLKVPLLNVLGLTASQLVATDASKNLQSLDTATYPSLTEISYVKGVTSTIQTQINGKFTIPTGLTTNYLPKWNGSGLANSLLYSSATGVGIGTVVPYESFEVANAATGGRVIFSDGGQANRYALLFSSPYSGQNYARILAYKYGTGASGLNLVLNDSGGNVGIGTTSPSEKLTVNGNIELPFGVDRFIKIGSSTNYFYNLQSVGDDFQILEAGSTPRLVIKYPSGNVGIGTTTPQSSLDVYGQFKTGLGLIGNPYSTQIVTGSSPFSNNLLFGTDGTGWKFAIGKNQGGTITELMTFQDNGNVGIGTTSPSTKLHIYSTSDLNGIRIENIVQSPLLDLISGNTDSGARNWRLSTNYYTFGDFNILSSSTQGGNPDILSRFNIDISGNIGIGKTNQTEKLDINGTIKAIGLKIPTGAVTGYVWKCTDGSTGAGSWQSAVIGERWKGTWDASSGSAPSGSPTEGDYYSVIEPGTYSSVYYPLNSYAYYNGTAWVYRPNNYSLVVASASVLGGIRVGSGLSIDGSGILSRNALVAADIPTLDPSKLSTGTSGHFLKTSGGGNTWASVVTTDVSNLQYYNGFDYYYTKTEADYNFVNRSTAQEISGIKTFLGVTEFENDVVLQGVKLYQGASAGTAYQVYGSNGTTQSWTTLTPSHIPNLDASKITSGTFADARISSAATWNAKQAALDGTGYVKISGTTVSYDNREFVDKSTTQTGIGGSKTFTAAMFGTSITLSAGITASAVLVKTSGYALNITPDITYNSEANGVKIHSGTVMFNDYQNLIFTAKRYVLERGNLKLGGNNTGSTGTVDFATERLDVTGNIRYSGALKPNNVTPTAGYFLKATSATENNWAKVTIEDLAQISPYKILGNSTTDIANIQQLGVNDLFTIMGQATNNHGDVLIVNGGVAKWARLEIDPQGLSNGKIGVGDSQNYLSELTNFEFLNKQYLSISRIGDYDKKINIGVNMADNNSFLTGVGGYINISATYGLKLPNYVGSGTRYLTIGADGTVGTTTSTGGSIQTLDDVLGVGNTGINKNIKIKTSTSNGYELWNNSDFLRGGLSLDVATDTVSLIASKLNIETGSGKIIIDAQDGSDIEISKAVAGSFIVLNGTKFSFHEDLLYQGSNTWGSGNNQATPQDGDVINFRFSGGKFVMNKI